MKVRVTVVGLFLLAAFSMATAQEGYKVIGNATTVPQSIAKKDLERIFLKRKKTLSNGQKAFPADLRNDSASKQKFCAEVLNKSLKEVDSYWQGQVFSGKEAPPPTMSSDREMITYVSRTPGAIGYVSSSASIEGVEVVNVIP